MLLFEEYMLVLVSYLCKYLKTLFPVSYDTFNINQIFSLFEYPKEKT
jgi:hypothetical protein